MILLGHGFPANPNELLNPETEFPVPPIPSMYHSLDMSKAIVPFAIVTCSYAYLFRSGLLCIKGMAQFSSYQGDMENWRCLYFSKRKWWGIYRHTDPNPDPRRTAEGHRACSNFRSMNSICSNTIALFYGYCIESLAENTVDKCCSKPLFGFHCSNDLIHPQMEEDCQCRGYC